MSDSEIPLDITGHESRDARSASIGSTGEQGDPGDGEPPGEGPGLPDPLADDEDPEAPDDTEEDEVEPVEVLVQLAEDGEIDPWDIDILAVTDKFLARLDDSDIRTSGRALFYASVLLRMKADEMLNPTDDAADAAEEADPWEQPMAENGPIGGPDPVAALEDEMDRRLDRKRARGSPETLDELVRELREAERNNWWKERREYDTSGSPEGYGRGTQELDYRAADDMRLDDEPTAADVTGTTHAENVDDIIAGVWAELLDHYEAGRDEVLFAEIVDSGGSRVETFLGLLFLSHRGQVVLQQDDLFGDLWIRDPNAGEAATEAVADD